MVSKQANRAGRLPGSKIGVLEMNKSVPLMHAAINAWQAGLRELAWLFYSLDESGVCRSKGEFFAGMQTHFSNASGVK
jgi:hypothetical protein